MTEPEAMAIIEATKEWVKDKLDDGLLMLDWNETIHELPLIISYRDPLMPDDLALLYYFEGFTDEVHVFRNGDDENPVASYRA